MQASSSGQKVKPQALPALLLIDDDPLICESLAWALKADFSVYQAASRQETHQLLEKLDSTPLLALVDLGLPPEPHTPDEGFALISELLAANAEAKILVLSGQSERANIHHALTLGAVDFIPKPCEPDLLRARLQHQLMMLDAERRDVDRAEPANRLMGESAVMAGLQAQIVQYADTPFPVLIQGESGTGKELVVEELHRRSGRSGEPLITINCAAFSAELLEAQIFGHARGAFTGATTARAGFFEDAGAGTLFLDEIGEFPIELQPKLLRVLENGEYYRLGETRPRTTRARVVTATNRELLEEIRAGNFRQDLYHRLSVLTLVVPSLREREHDALMLLEHFRQLYAEKVAPFGLDEAAKQRLESYTFPGNVRELRNIVIRLGARYPGREVGLTELEAELDLFADTQEAVDDLTRQQMRAGCFCLDEVLGVWEQRYINAAMKMCSGNLSKAARLLGINRTTLYSRMQRLSNSADQH